ncbi:uncharacterized protein DNG_01823 [Cephalotrichum gorgonifer]|uniref:Uncharacterized protein n=1 Tax=Cephalotrichum gorgonifer TaxID=2041049 RepID=A0AAE8MTW9_9PEZI|nr:uncharacterized protein DNG_01823 [Cephalotrichum gorgonifer]
MSAQHSVPTVRQLSRQMEKLPPACLLCKDHLAEAGTKAALAPRRLPPLFQELTPDPNIGLSARDLRGVISWAMSGLAEMQGRGEFENNWEYDEQYWEWKGWETYLGGKVGDEETEESEDGESAEEHGEFDDCDTIAGERVASMVVDRLHHDQEFRGWVVKAVSQVVKDEGAQEEEEVIGAVDDTPPTGAPSTDAKIQTGESQNVPPNTSSGFYVEALREKITVAKAKLDAFRADTAYLHSEFEVYKECIAAHSIRAFARQETIARAIGKSHAWGVPCSLCPPISPGSIGGWSAEARGLGKELVRVWAELVVAEIDLSREIHGRSIIAGVLESMRNQNAAFRDMWAGVIERRGGHEGNSLAEDIMFDPRSWLGTGRIRGAGEQDPWEEEDWDVEIAGDEAGGLWMVPGDVFTNVLPELLRVIADEPDLEEDAQMEIAKDETGGVWVTPETARALIDEYNPDEEMERDIYQ